MRREERFSAILGRLADGGSVGVAELAQDLGVASATIRRDLALLEQQRLLGRTHGGAVVHAVSYELPLRYKGVRHADEKRRIAQEAASHVAEGMAVGLTGGTTATEVARALADRQGLTIVTNALNIASELAVRPNLTLVVTGGTVRGNSYELSGPAGRSQPRLAQPRHRLRGRGRDRRPGRVHDAPRRGGPQQRRHDRPRPPGRGGGRQF